MSQAEGMGGTGSPGHEGARPAARQGARADRVQDGAVLPGEDETQPLPPHQGFPSASQPSCRGPTRARSGALLQRCLAAAAAAASGLWGNWLRCHPDTEPTDGGLDISLGAWARGGRGLGQGASCRMCIRGRSPHLPRPIQVPPGHTQPGARSGPGSSPAHARVPGGAQGVIGVPRLQTKEGGRGGRAGPGAGLC